MYYISSIDRLTLFQKWGFHIFKTKHEATFKKIVNSKTARLNDIYLFNVKKKTFYIENDHEIFSTLC